MSGQNRVSDWYSGRLVSTTAQLVLIALAAVLAPILADLSGRLAVPSVVIELVFGILLGPTVFGWVHSTGIVDALANFGLAYLMFLAGFELELPRFRGRPIELATASWAGSLILAGVAGLVLVISGHRHGDIIIGLALCTTALSTLLPILQDAGILPTEFGRHALAIGSVGELGPIILVSIVLSGRNPGTSGLLLLIFLALAAGAAYAASREWHQRITDLMRRGLHASSQLPVRVCLLLIISFALLSTDLKLDLLLGTFGAGMIVRIAIGGKEEDDDVVIFRSKLEAVGFGFLVPIFFVVSGVRLGFSSFGSHPGDLLLIPLFFGLLLVIRGLPVLLVYRTTLARTQRLSLSLMAATGLPLIVVITTIGIADGYISEETGAALVAAGMLTVLLLPNLALRLLKTTPDRHIEAVPATVG